MNAMKKIGITMLLLVCCLSLLGCMLLGGGNDSVQKDKIFEYVAEHTDVLSAFPYETYRITTDYETEIPFIKDILGQDTIVKSVYRPSRDIFRFDCGGTGNVSSSTYCGLYYSEKDVPYAFEFQDTALFTQLSDGVYEWESEDQQKVFYTERILPKWFWYYQVWL